MNFSSLKQEKSKFGHFLFFQMVALIETGYRLPQCRDLSAILNGCVYWFQPDAVVHGSVLYCGEVGEEARLG